MSKERSAGRTLAAMRKRVRAWYARNRRSMPWRETRDAYRVWVSEVMLQQTRVAAVLPYYLKFVKRFPTVRALARARSEDVLRLWAGLGYYSRARNLHLAAKEMVARHGGKFPRDVEVALALPGVGRYTAAAVLSIAYGEPLAVVDGNVARVLARLGGVRGDLRATGRWKRWEEEAQKLMTENGEWRVTSGEKSRKSKIEIRNLKIQFHNWSTNRRQDAGGTKAGEWNQAMMELGATVCTPRAPRCGECPVARWCEARRLGIVEKIPFALKKREAERVEIAAAVMVDERGRTLLVKPSRAETNGVFSGMWQFPAVEVARLASERQLQKILKPQMNADERGWVKKEEKRKRGREEGKFKGVKGEWVELDEVRHTVTFRDVRVRPYLVRVEKLPRLERGRIVRLDGVNSMAVSSATRKIARVATSELKQNRGEMR